MLIRPAAHAESHEPAAGLETKAARRWNPALHPRDARGRFIETGGTVRLWGGKLARVVRALPHDRILVQDRDSNGGFTGRRHTTSAKQVTVVARPDGSAPTGDEKKVVAEDERRLKDSKRGNGIARDDDGDPSTPNEPHNVDDQGQPIGDDDRDGPDAGDDQDEPANGAHPVIHDALPNQRHAAGARFSDTAAVRAHFTQLAEQPGTKPEMATFLRSVAGDDDLRITTSGRLAVLHDDDSGRWYLTATGTGQRMDAAGDFATAQEAERFATYMEGPDGDAGFDFSDPNLDQAARTWKSRRGENIQAAITRARSDFQNGQQAPAAKKTAAPKKTAAARTGAQGQRFATLKDVRAHWTALRENASEQDRTGLDALLADKRLKLAGSGQFVITKRRDGMFQPVASGSGQWAGPPFAGQREAQDFADNVVAARLRDRDGNTLDLSDPAVQPREWRSDSNQSLDEVLSGLSRGSGKNQERRDRDKQAIAGRREPASLDTEQLRTERAELARARTSYEPDDVAAARKERMAAIDAELERRQNSNDAGPEPYDPSLEEQTDPKTGQITLYRTPQGVTRDVGGRFGVGEPVRDKLGNSWVVISATPDGDINVRRPGLRYEDPLGVPETFKANELSSMDGHMPWHPDKARAAADLERRGSGDNQPAAGADDQVTLSPDEVNGPAAAARAAKAPSAMSDPEIRDEIVSLMEREMAAGGELSGVDRTRLQVLEAEEGRRAGRAPKREEAKPKPQTEEPGGLFDVGPEEQQRFVADPNNPDDVANEPTGTPDMFADAEGRDTSRLRPPQSRKPGDFQVGDRFVDADGRTRTVAEAPLRTSRGRIRVVDENGEELFLAPDRELRVLHPDEDAPKAPEANTPNTNVPEGDTTDADTPEGQTPAADAPTPDAADAPEGDASPDDTPEAGAADTNAPDAEAPEGEPSLTSAQAGALDSALNGLGQVDAPQSVVRVLMRHGYVEERRKPSSMGRGRTIATYHLTPEGKRRAEASRADRERPIPDQVQINHTGTGTTIHFPTSNGTVSEEEFGVLRRLGFKASRDRSQPRYFYLPSTMTLSRRDDKVRQLKEWLERRNVDYRMPSDDPDEKPELSDEQLQQLRGKYHAPAGTWATTDFQPGDEVWTGRSWDRVDSVGPKNLRLQSWGSTPYDRVLARRRGGEIRTMFDAPTDDGAPRPGADDPKTMRDEAITAELAHLNDATLPEGNAPAARAVRRQVTARIRALNDVQSERTFARRRAEMDRRDQAGLVRDPARLSGLKGEQVQGRDGAPIGAVYQEKKGKWRFVDRDGRTPGNRGVPLTFPSRAAAITALNKLADARNERSGEGWGHSAWDDVQPGDTIRLPELGRPEGSFRRVITGWSEPLEVSEIRRGDMGQVLITGRRGDEDVQLEVPHADATFGASKPGNVPDRDPSDAGGGMDWRQMRPDDFGQDELPAAAGDQNQPRPADEFGTPDLIANGTPDTPEPSAPGAPESGAPGDETQTARMVADQLPELPPLPRLTGLNRQDKEDVRRIQQDYNQVRQSLDGILNGNPPTGDAREDLRRVRQNLDYIQQRLNRHLLGDDPKVDDARSGMIDLGNTLDEALQKLPERTPEPQGDGPNGGTLYHPWDLEDGDLVAFQASDGVNSGLAPFYGTYRGASSTANGRTLVTYEGREWNEDRQRWENRGFQNTVTMPPRGLVERFTSEQWEAWRRPNRTDASNTTPDTTTVPDAPIRDTSPADMDDADISAELRELQAWQDRHVNRSGEGPHVQEGRVMLALAPVASRRAALGEEQRNRSIARDQQNRREKAARQREELNARAEVGDLNESGKYPVAVDGTPDVGTVSKLGRTWQYTRADGTTSPDTYKTRLDAVAALVFNHDVRRENDARRARQDEARSQTPDGWVLGDRADVAENDIIRLPITQRDGSGRPYPTGWRQPVRVNSVTRNDNGTMSLSVSNLDGSRSDIGHVFLSHPDDTFAWASDRTRPEPTPKWRHELRARMGDIGDDIATLQRREGLQDPERIQRLQDLIQRVSRGETDDLQGDLRQIRDEAAWLESQFDDPDLELPYETRRTRSWATAARMKAERDLRYPDFQNVGEGNGDGGRNDADPPEQPTALATPEVELVRSLYRAFEEAARATFGSDGQPRGLGPHIPERMREAEEALAAGNRTQAIQHLDAAARWAWPFEGGGEHELDQARRAFAVAAHDAAVRLEPLRDGERLTTNRRLKKGDITRDRGGRYYRVQDARDRGHTYETWVEEGPLVPEESVGVGFGHQPADFTVVVADENSPAVREFIEAEKQRVAADKAERERIAADRTARLAERRRAARSELEAQAGGDWVGADALAAGDQVTVHDGHDNRGQTTTVTGHLLAPPRQVDATRNGEKVPAWRLHIGEEGDEPNLRNLVTIDRDDRVQRHADADTAGAPEPGSDSKHDNQDSGDRSADGESNEGQDDQQQGDDQGDEENRRQRRDGDMDGGAAGPDGGPGAGGASGPGGGRDESSDGPNGSDDDQGSPDEEQNGDDNERRGRRRRGNRGGGNGGPGGGGPGGPRLPHLNLPDIDGPNDGDGNGNGGRDGGDSGDSGGPVRHSDVDSLRSAWKAGEGLTPAEDTPQRRAVLAEAADREGLTLSPNGGLVTWPERQDDGSTVWRFAQARNGTNLPGITLTSDDPEEARALAGRFEEISDANGDRFDWHQSWGPSSIAQWRDSEGRNLPSALRAAQDDHEEERRGTYTLPEDLTGMGDDELANAWGQGLTPADEMRVMAEMDRRDATDQRVRDAVPDTPPADADEAEARGRAMDEALGFGDTDVTRPRRTREEALRAEFVDLDEARYLAAVAYTNGYFFNRQNEASEFDERELFSGGGLSAWGRWRNLASEELLEWFDNNGGRMTFNQFKQKRRADERRYREEREVDEAAGDSPETTGADGAGTDTPELDTNDAEPEPETGTPPAEPEVPDAPAAPDAPSGTPRFSGVDEVRDRLRRGETDALSNPTAGPYGGPAEIARNPTLEMSEGGRLAIVQVLQNGAGWRVLAPGSGEPVATAFDREDALAKARILESVRDADGQPFPWDAPDAAQRALAFRGSNGDSLGEAVARQMSEHGSDEGVNKHWLQDAQRYFDNETRVDRQYDAWRAQQEADGYTVPVDVNDTQEGDEVSALDEELGKTQRGRLTEPMDAAQSNRPGMWPFTVGSHYGVRTEDRAIDVYPNGHAAQGPFNRFYFRNTPDRPIAMRRPRPGEDERNRQEETSEPTPETVMPPAPEVPAEPQDEPDSTPDTGTPGSAALAAAPNTPEPEPAVTVPDEPQGEPEPIGGQPAQWARVEDLVPGDMVRINGTTKRGRPNQRAGYAYTAPERVEVTRRGRTEQMWRTWVTENPDGTGEAGNVYTSINANAARAEAPDEIVPGSPESGAQASLRSGDLPDEIPADGAGRGLFPGSTVTGSGRREGTVTGATTNTVSVHWSDGRDEDNVTPTSLTVTDGQRPDGWTANGQRVTPQHVVTDADGALLGPVDEVDGDDVTINTAEGRITRSAGDLRVAGEVRDDVPPAAPVTGIDEPAAADLKEGDVVVLDLDDTLTTVAITSPPRRDGDRITLDYADTSTGELGEIEVDAHAVLPRAQGADGNAPELGPDDAPDAADDLEVHEPPHHVEPVNGPTTDPQLTTADRDVIGDQADGPDDNPDAYQAAVRIDADLPVTPEQASALATQLRESADPSTREGRAALRAADHLDRAAGRTPPAGHNRPLPTNAAQVGEGDLIAMPDERNGDKVRTFRVIDVEDGPGGVRSFLLEDENHQWRRRVVHGAMPMWQLPEAELDAPSAPAPDGTPTAPYAPFPYLPSAPVAPTAEDDLPDWLGGSPAQPTAPSTPTTPTAPNATAPNTTPAAPTTLTAPNTATTPSTPTAPTAPDTTPSAPVAQALPAQLRVGDVIDAPVSRTGGQLNSHRRLTLIAPPRRNGWWMQLTAMDDDGNVHDFGLHNGRAVNVYDRNRPTPALPPTGTPRDPNPAPQTTVDGLVRANARGLHARIREEAIAATQPAGDIHALREQIARRVTPEALQEIRQNAQQEGLTALDAAGITGPERREARKAMRKARDEAHDEQVRAILRTINDLEPLPGESNEDLAARARDLLRRIPADGGTPTRPDTDGDADVTATVADHTRDALNALLQDLQNAGADPGDVQQIVRSLTRQLAGTRQATARQITRRVTAANPAAGRQPGLLVKVLALLVRMAKRLAELVKAGARKIAEKYRNTRERLARLRAFLGRMARRVRHFPESRRLARLHRAVNLPSTDGESLSARISHWAGLMPEPGRFGQAQRRVTWWRPTSWGQLAAGRLPGRSDRIQWAPDRAADGGPGLTALRHMAALRAAGGDVDQDVTRRLSAALGDDFGEDAHTTLQHADDYVATSEQRLVRLQAARSGATIPDDPDLEIEIEAARTELQSARRDYSDLRSRYAAAVPDAVAAALADIRDVGPDGNAALVFGPDSDPDAERAVRGVQRVIPRTWLSTPQARRVTAVDGAQGRYEPDTQRITVADLADGGLGTAGNALAQHLARNLDDLDAAQRAFWFSRTHTGRPGARRMNRGPLGRLLSRQQTQPETGDTLARSVQALFNGDWYLDDDLRAFLLGLLATR